MNPSLFDLIDRITQKDELALAELRRLTQQRLMTTVIRIVRNRDTAEEIVQDVYTYVWFRAQYFNSNRSHPLSWLQMLCRSRAIDYVRGLKRQSIFIAFDDRVGHLPGTPQSEPDAFWMHDRIAEGLIRLEAQQRDFIDQAFFEGFTHAEISARTGVPLGTVKTRIRGALLQLRETFPAPAA